MIRGTENVPYTLGQPQYFGTVVEKLTEVGENSCQYLNRKTSVE